MSTGVLANGELMQTYADKFMDIYCKDKNSRYRSYDYIHSFYLKRIIHIFSSVKIIL